MTGFFIAIVSIYCVWMMRYFFAWKKLASFSSEKKEQVLISIIVPFCNEEKNIVNCLEKLCLQNYPSHLYEVIAVNDHSDDQSAALAEKVSEQFTVVRNISNELAPGKKNAIASGINHAKGNLMVTVDADVSVKNSWLTNIAGYFTRNNFEMIIMPVMFHEETDWFDAWQSLELMSLTGTTAAAVGLKDPVMCNGANLAFTKSSFQRADGYQGNENISSGDDMFFMLKLKKQSPEKIGYLHSPSVIATTTAAASLREFFNQRLRWASKSGHYRDPTVIFLAIVVWLCNLGIIVLTVGVFTQHLPAWLLIFPFLKLIIDFIFLEEVSGFYNKKHVLWHYPLMMMVYPFYAVLIPVISFVYKPGWKNIPHEKKSTGKIYS